MHALCECQLVHRARLHGTCAPVCMPRRACRGALVETRMPRRTCGTRMPRRACRRDAETRMPPRCAAMGMSSRACHARMPIRAPATEHLATTEHWLPDVRLLHSPDFFWGAGSVGRADRGGMLTDHTEAHVPDLDPGLCTVARSECSGVWARCPSVPNRELAVTDVPRVRITYISSSTRR